jgi:hypothetical protein
MPHSSRDPAHGDQAKYYKSRETAPFREALPHIAVETGLAGWAYRIRTEKRPVNAVSFSSNTGRFLVRR